MENLNKLKNFANRLSGCSNLRIGTRFLTEFHDDGTITNNKFDCLRHLHIKPLELVLSIVPVLYVKNELQWSICCEEGGWITTHTFCDSLFEHYKCIN